MLLRNPHTPLRVAVALALSVLTLSACSGNSQQALLSKARQEIAAGKNRAALVDLRSLVKQHPKDAQGRLLLGSLLFKLGDPGAAAAQLQQASQLGDIPISARFQLVQSLIQIGNLDNATKALDAIKTTAPSQKAEQIAFQGEIALSKKETAKAAKAFAAALAKNPHSARALVGQSMIALMASKPHLALQKADMAIQIAPKDATAWLAKGYAAFAQHEIQNASTYIEQALKYGPPDLSPGQIFLARGRLAQTELALGQRDQALRNVNAMLAQSPKQPYPNYLRGLIAYENKHYANAAQYLQTSLNSDPYNVQALTLLASAEAQQGQDVLAMNHLSGALAQDPQNPQARQLMAALQLKSGEDERAIQTLLGDKTGSANAGEILSLFTSPDAAIKTLSAIRAQNHGGTHGDAVKLALAQALLMSAKQQQALSVLNEISGGGDTQLNQLRLKAAAYLQAHQTAKAIDVAHQISSDDPQNATALTLAAVIYAAANEDNLARSTLQKAHALKPDDTQVTTLLASLALKHGHVEKAEGYYRSALQHDPKNLIAIMSLARISAIRGDSRAALGWLEKAKTDHPKAPEPLVALAQYHLAIKQPSNALNDIQQAVALVPGNPAILTLLAKTQLANGAKDAALETFRNVAKLDPSNPYYGMNLAAMQTLLKNMKGAQSTLESITSKHPDYYPAFRALAMTQWRNGEKKAAFATATKVDQGEQGHIQSAVLTGDLDLLNKDYTAALQQYRIAYSQLPSRDIVLRIYTAESAGHIGHPGNTLLDWLHTHPDDATLRNVLALYYLNSGNLKDSEIQYRLVAKQMPNNPLVLNNLAWIVSQNNLTKSLPYAEKAHNLLPENPAIADTLGWILVHNGKADAGLPLLKLAAEKKPDLGDVQYHYAAALSQTGHEHQSVSVLQKVLGTKNTFKERSEAEKLLQRLLKSTD
nr:XrtA/PEP-CTERM system TPR-repeat protein PrsT [Acidihalobacter aeolianus]